MSGKNLAKSVPTLKDSDLNILKGNHPYSALFDSISELDKDDIITDPKCKMCHHPNRAVLEEEFEKSGRANFAKIAQMLKDYESANPAILKVSYSHMKRHLLKHYLVQEKQIQMREYAARHTSWMNKKISDDEKLEALKSALEMEFVEIASDDNLFVLKKAEAMAKLSKSIVDIITMQGRLKSEIDGVGVLMEKVVGIWSDMIRNETDDGAKRALMTMLDSFQDSLNGIERGSIEVS